MDRIPRYIRTYLLHCENGFEAAITNPKLYNITSLCSLTLFPVIWWAVAIFLYGVNINANCVTPAQRNIFVYRVLIKLIPTLEGHVSTSTLANQL